MKVYWNRNMLVILLLGYSCGLPLALTIATLQAWLSSAHVDITQIGAFSLVGMPLALKFLWAPLLDRYKMPFLDHRRGWMLTTQILLMASIFLLGHTHPEISLMPTVILATLTSFFSASQDIVVDAYRREALPQEQWGASFGVYSAGYRIAMIASGALALVLSDHLPWNQVYSILGVTVLIGIAGTLIAAPTPPNASAPRTLKDAVFLPFLEFFRRRGAIEMLAFLLLYKLDAMLTIALTTPFMLSLGFSRTEIGAVTKGYGVIATLVGSLLGGGVIARFGIHKSLWIFGITQAFAGLSYMALAYAGKDLAYMAMAVTVENFFSGTAIAAFSAFMMAICDRRYTATQYALLSSFMALSRYITQAPSGYLVQFFGWKMYYLFCIAAGIPGLLLLLRYPKWTFASDVHE